VGKARILRREAMEMRLRWIGAGLLALVVIGAIFLFVRFYGQRAGWWSTVLPFAGHSHIVHSMWNPVRAVLRHIFGHANG